MFAARKTDRSLWKLLNVTDVVLLGLKIVFCFLRVNHGA